VPSFFFSLAAIGYLQRAWWKSDTPEHWLVIALILYGAEKNFWCFFQVARRTKPQQQPKGGGSMWLWRN
jgi:hypothetical protein